MQQFISEYLDGHQKVLAKLEASTGDIQQAAERCIAALRNGRKLLICGNGGSAADAPSAGDATEVATIPCRSYFRER